MTGGKVIVLNTQKNFQEYISKSAPNSRKLTEMDMIDLKTLIQKHINQTGSEVAKEILVNEKNWENIFTVFGGIAAVNNDQILIKQEEVKALD